MLEMCVGTFAESNSAIQSLWHSHVALAFVAQLEVFHLIIGLVEAFWDGLCVWASCLQVFSLILEIAQHVFVCIVYKRSRLIEWLDFDNVQLYLLL